MLSKVGEKFAHFNTTTIIIFRLFNGLCRNDDASCDLGEHVLLKHQYPICQYFLNLSCIADDCPYLHVKYTDGLDPCIEFNNGNCHRGLMVCWMMSLCVWSGANTHTPLPIHTLALFFSFVIFPGA